MNAKVIAFAAAVVLVLIGQSIDVAGVRTIFAGATAPAPEMIDPGFDEFSFPDPGVPLGAVVMAPGEVTCGGVARILPGPRTTRALNGTRPVSLAAAPTQCV